MEDSNNYFFLDPNLLELSDETKSIINTFQCSICHGISYNPVECTSCGNCFCYECIMNWINQNKKCVFRCENPIIKYSTLAGNIISLLNFKCKNGCGGIINYNDIKEHYESNCPNINFKEAYFNMIKQKENIQKQINNFQIKK